MTAPALLHQQRPAADLVRDLRAGLREAADLVAQLESAPRRATAEQLTAQLSGLHRGAALLTHELTPAVGIG